ncbi:putative chitinase 3, partial [Cyphomyrmex costatus]
GTYLVATLYVVTLGILNGSLADIPTECPKTNVQNETVFVPHENDCTKFYSCHMGVKGKEIDCPFMDEDGNKLHFNYKLQVCDWPWRAGCQTSNSTTSSTISTSITTCDYYYSCFNETTTKEITTPTITTETPTTKYPNKPREKCPPRESTEEARIAHPCLCNQYYDCINGEKILQTCPIGKHFDYEREVCDWASVVKCIRPIPTFNILSSDIPINDYNTTCAPEGRAFLHNTDCSTYYLCSNGEKILKQCKEGLHFNTTIQTCDYPQKSCDLNKSSPRINLDICPPPDSVQKVFLPHECECTQYYECIGGKKVLRFCPNRLHFDHVWQICNDPIEAKCVANTISPPTTILTTSSTAIDEPRITCPPQGSTEKLLLPHPCICNQYYECVEGDKVLRTCPTDMYFNYATEVCDWSTKVKCVSPFPSHNIQINDHNTNNKCSPNDRAFSHENSCSEYYLCLKGEKVLKHCIEGLHFNVTIQMCDYPQKKCDLNTPGPQPIPTIILDVCPPAGSIEKVLLPHECDCTQYYECIDEKRILRDCLNGLHYDYVRQICNVPTEARCNDFTTTIPKGSFPITPDLNEKNNIKKIDEIVENPDPSTCIGICPEEDPEYVVLLSNDDCKKFCMCSGGYAWVQSCPEPLYFDSVERICKKKKDAICGVRLYNQDSAFMIDNLVDNDNSMKTLITTNNKHRTYDNLDPSTCIGTCPKKDPEFPVLLPNDDCKKFCFCSRGVAWVQLCPVTLYFDSVERICKKKKDAICGVRLYNQDSAFMIDNLVDNDNSMKTLITTNNKHRTYDNLDPSTCIGTCPEEDPELAVLLPNDDCKKFCFCSGGVAWVQPCPVPLYFDSVERICKKKKDAICGVRLYNQDSAFMIDNLVDNDNSMKTLITTNNKHRTYDNLDPSTCIGTCPEEDPELAVLLPNDDCKKFCFCSGGVAWVQPCPEPLYFDSVKKVCKKKKDAVCGVRSYHQYNAFMITKVIKNDSFLKSLTNENNNKYETYNDLDPSTCIGTCPEEDSEFAVLLPNDDCKKFCFCSGGVAWVQPCPEPLYFDSVEKTCRRKRDAVCGVRSYNQNSAFTIDKTIDNSIKTLTDEDNNKRETYNNFDPSTCIGTCPEEGPEFGVLLPNDDCKKFCLCSGGMVAWVQTCPGPLYFDSVEKTCKLKKNAVCAVRLFNEDHVFMVNEK